MNTGKIENKIEVQKFLELIKTRRSVRDFLPEIIPDEDIRTIITAASWAPSGSNCQNWHFVVVRSKDVKEQIAEAVRGKIEQYSKKIDSSRAKKEFLAYTRYYAFFENAPVIIAVVKKPYDSLTLRIMKRYNLSGDYHSSSDIQGPAAAIENLLLMAHCMGYGTCWMTGPLIARIEIEKVLNIKAPDELLAIVPLGRAAGTSKPTERKAADEIMTYD